MAPPFSLTGRHDLWSGFYKKGLRERQYQLKLGFPNLFSRSDGADTDGDDEMFPINGLDEEVANNMIENCIGTIGLPVGLALNLTMNGRPFVIPMAVEEPSIIAAVSGAAKTVMQCAEQGSFTASSSECNIIFAQVQLLDIAGDDIPSAIVRLEAQKGTLLDIANRYCPSMYSRGGGVVDITYRRVPRSKPERHSQNQVDLASDTEWLIVHLHIDVKDAMGANIASKVAEGVAPTLSAISGGRVGLRIVSNLCTERWARASFRIPVSKLAYKDVSGEELARRIVEAYQWAEDDPFRATTHNKGIMNGIDAVAVALGQDWRALEAAAHVRACGNDQNRYGSLTKYWLERFDQPDVKENGGKPETFFCASLELPVPCGTKGGVLQTHPVYRYTMGLCGNPDSKTLGQLLVCVGLAQNFAALRALCSEGISKGHMNLHARNIAIAAGAPINVVGEVTSWMISSEKISLKAAHEYLEAHQLHTMIQTSHSPVNGKPPSMFYFEESAEQSGPSAPGFEGTVTLNIAFQTLGEYPISIELSGRAEIGDMMQELFGDKTGAWIASAMKVINACQLVPRKGSRRSNIPLVRRLKYITLIINVLLRRLSAKFPLQTQLFVETVLSRSRAAVISPQPPTDSVTTRPRSKSIGTSSLPPKESFWNDELEWTLPEESGLFNDDILAQIFDNIDASTNDMRFAKIGFPLLLALWQVFELRVAHLATDRRLYAMLVEEQRRTVCSVAAGPPYEILDLQSLLSVHAKRLPVKLFVLLDAITFDYVDMDFARLSEIDTLTFFVEWHMMRIHDVSR
ncbi:substrate-binding domain of hmg-CoA reductase [Gonapodya prolifera JEL478]|uniref:3-hydroxy-3-methylglutaryl coenzyme A reductase n=1 Tax=Gonapodya prolifera (strain JEL478) TaxID=1344416 RepID=A0A139AZC9_GONPJ|nr:substrate-binding domain of hmg-CoA reductase [Gonapodya prolifera JEL478]|eukprot:KXS22108.1 substrate-binding domain of hmg-CoA reductase [Gonapodya prolifera JEL478]